MKKIIQYNFIFFLFVYSTLFISVANAFQYVVEDSLKTASENEIIVKFKPSYNLYKGLNGVENIQTGNTDFDSLNKKYKCTGAEQLFKHTKEQLKKGDDLNLENVYILKFEAIDDIDELINSYLNTGLFEYVEPNFIGKGGGVRSVTPNDQYYSRQWSLNNNGTFPSPELAKADADIDMDEAWEIEQGDAAIVIAVLDTGAKLDHPEFAGRIWTNINETPGNGIDDDNNGYIDDYNAWDFAYDDNTPADSHGHGTNVAGIIGATGNNNIGYAGVNWNSRLMICQILNVENWGYYSWWTSAIYYAVNNGANVINMSVGGTSPSSSMEDALNYAYLNNVHVVSIMMNENNEVPYYPGAYPTTFAVGATNPNDTRCDPFSWGGGSNYGTHIDVVAPGNYIYGLSHLSNTNYNWSCAGTSQAGPHVTGLISLMLSLDNSRSIEEIWQIIRDTAEDLVGDPAEDLPGWDKYYGYGRINANAALTYLLTNIDDNKNDLSPGSFYLSQNYPNPFNPATTIDYQLPQSGNVILKIYNILGKEEDELINEFKTDGYYSIQFNASEFSSGLYFYKIQVGEFSDVRKMLLIK